MRLIPGVLVAVLLIPRAGTAQTAAPVPEEQRFFVDVNFFGSAGTLAKVRTFRSYALISAEVASFEATYPKPSRANLFPLVDVGGGFLLMPALGFGVSYSRAVFEDTADLAVTVPHPVFLNSPASDTGVTEDTLTREEATTHVSLLFLPVRLARIHVRLFGGPTFFSYNADMVNDILYTQTFDPMSPANDVAITGATTQEASGSAVGFHVGGDVAWFFTPMLGVAGGVRFSRGTVTIDEEPLSRLSQEIRAGATLLFLGVRARFGR